ncbi:MAG: Bax inhibitor-1 family protein [Planctomycetaceae bacterium]|nr:Bax inhibitor-1 family protein [Planctomycetaceae bacterium]
MPHNMQRNQSFDTDFAAPTDLFAIAAAADERAGFIMKTYLYVFGAIAAFIAIETALFTAVGGPEKMWAIVGPILATIPLGWLGVLVSFMVVAWIAEKWAMSNTRSAVQHAGLALYIVALSILFLPLLCFAQMKGGPNTILSAAMSTAGLFAMLTLAVFITRKDFSFLKSSLTFGALAALGFIATAAVFKFALGPIFMYAMIALFCGYILYYTSNILHHYRIGQHVAAALALFASVMMLFWYILQLFMSRE